MMAEWHWEKKNQMKWSVYIQDINSLLEMCENCKIFLSWD